MNTSGMRYYSNSFDSIRDKRLQSELKAHLGDKSSFFTHHTLHFVSRFLASLCYPSLLKPGETIFYQYHPLKPALLFSSPYFPSYTICPAVFFPSPDGYATSQTYFNSVLANLESNHHS
ncbi:hypothetical protein Forpe1208_v005975 [Fusarium oxysporum f. sp. rapae]|uniref:Uncharacterized protein n=1 Tax=Fusarium oxysporum f. sp. rapae TaxID=485398 RepID=A0A8J5PD26_FUSOX|nr:hypothetical protein Forpe1208_v005975 [Fusarium oxysporum f. sp. rapae]